MSLIERAESIKVVVFDSDLVLENSSRLRLGFSISIDGRIWSTYPASYADLIDGQNPNIIKN